MKHNWRHARPVRHRGPHGPRLHHRAVRAGGGERPRRALADGWRAARELAAWKSSVTLGVAGGEGRRLDADSSPAHEGDVRQATAHVELDGLQSQDVAVQLLHGAIDSSGPFVGRPEIVPMTHVGRNTTFECSYTVGSAGPYGLTLRVIPTHPAMVTPVELGVAAWAH